MALGSNRDYVTRDRKIRRQNAVMKARAEVLVAEGMSESEATVQALRECANGLLKAELKAWVDPILAHHREMRKLHAPKPEPTVAELRAAFLTRMKNGGN